MKWTQEFPKVAGWYFFREGHEAETRVVEIIDNSEHFGKPAGWAIRAFDHLNSERNREPGYQWAGPIPEPQ